MEAFEKHLQHFGHLKHESLKIAITVVYIYNFTKCISKYLFSPKRAMLDPFSNFLEMQVFPVFAG